MRWPFSYVTRQVCSAIRRLAIVDDVELQVALGDIDPRSPLPVFLVEILADDLDDEAKLTAAARDKIADKASELAHQINEQSPPGVRWCVRLLVESHSRNDVVGVLAVEWAILPAVAVEA